MNKYYLFTLLLLPILSIAQSNYKNGYVVNLKGDTVRGYINLKEWGHNPSDISFKPTVNDKPQQLGLPDINYFEVNGYVSYHQYTVAVSLNPVDISSPASAADTTSAIDNVFLKVLQKGKNVTLYSYKDGLKERFYIKDNDMRIPAELRFGIYQSRISDNVVNQTTYRFQLSQMVVKYNSGSDKLLAEVQQSAYNESDLMKIASGINENASSQASLRSRNNGSTVRFFAGIGLISNTVKDGQYYGSPSSVSTAPKIAAGADLIVNPAVGHLIFRVELAYSANNYTFNDISDPIFNVANPQSNTIKVKQNVISITPQIIYNIYNNERLKVFVDLGYCLNILSYPPNQVSQSGGTTTTSDNIIFDSKSNYSVFQFKAGVVIAKRFEIYGAYFPKANLSDSFTYTNDISSYQVGINYFFGKGAR